MCYLRLCPRYTYPAWWLHALLTPTEGQTARITITDVPSDLPQQVKVWCRLSGGTGSRSRVAGGAQKSRAVRKDNYTFPEVSIWEIWGLPWKPSKSLCDMGGGGSGLPPGHNSQGLITTTPSQTFGLALFHLATNAVNNRCGREWWCRGQAEPPPFSATTAFGRHGNKGDAMKRMGQH